MREQDDAPGAPAGDAEVELVAPATAADGWLTAAPDVPEGPRCPWCSAPLTDRDATRCGACGAQLARDADRPIPGVTALDPAAMRAVTAPLKPRTRRSVFSWLTGDVDLVDVPPPVSPAPGDPAPWNAGSAAPPGVDTMGLPPVTVSTLGPASADALAPPDARLRREMLKMELEALGLAPEEEVGPVAGAAAVDEADDAATLPAPPGSVDPAFGAHAPDDPAAAEGTPAASDRASTGPDAPGRA